MTENPQKSFIFKSRRRFIKVIGVVAATAATPAVALSQANQTPAKSDNRYQRGLAALKQIGGEGYERFVTGSADIAPDLDRFLLEYAYGDIISRPGLDLRARQLATVAALTVMANSPATLQFHINGALNVGATRREIVEMILHLLPFAGFPPVQSAIASAKDVFSKRPDSEQNIQPAAPSVNANGDRLQRGTQAINNITKGSAEQVIASFQDIAPDLSRFIVEFAYGDVISRPGLDRKMRQLGTVAALTALSTAAAQNPLRVHINGALNVGAEQSEVVEVILQMLVYAGFPATQNGIAVAREVFKQRDSNPN
jgi:4-carboxymuconolactone decarboxylase